MQKIYKYKHIVSDKIEDLDSSHPLDKTRDKTQFIKLLLKDLNIQNYEDISNDKKNLFRIYYKNMYYNIFIEFPDGGGKDVTYNNSSKKVSIPFNIRAFKNIINNFERVLVINIYIPLDDKKEPDISKRTYLVVDPKQIYSSKVIENKTNNPSSRWIELTDILYSSNDISNNELWNTNKKKNVYIVNHKNISIFFDAFLKKEYMEMITLELKNTNLLDLNNENNKKYNKYRKLFREALISERGVKCEMINCEIKTLELMIASHIKPVNLILSDQNLTNEEKIEEIIDTNNGFLFCPNHDALFDKFLITFSQNGILNISRLIKNEISCLNLNENKENKSIKISNKCVFKYLSVHNEKFNNKFK